MHGTCTVCGKRGRRSHTLFQTVSPFNKHEDGTVKTPQQIGRELQAQADRICKEPFSHAACEQWRQV